MSGLRCFNDPAEGMVAEDSPAKDSLAYIQLEKQNERLKEALIKYACMLLALFHIC